MIKVKEINLEKGRPTAEVAVRDMIGQLGTYKRLGYRALILIHGYGSSGTGGSIRRAVRDKLKEASLSGLVKAWCSGEEWMNRRREMIDYCSQLKQFEGGVSGNPGVTVVLLKS